MVWLCLAMTLLVESWLWEQEKSPHNFPWQGYDRVDPRNRLSLPHDLFLNDRNKVVVGNPMSELWRDTHCHAFNSRAHVDLCMNERLGNNEEQTGGSVWLVEMTYSEVLMTNILAKSKRKKSKFCSFSFLLRVKIRPHRISKYHNVLKAMHRTLKGCNYLKCIRRWRYSRG